MPVSSLFHTVAPPTAATYQRQSMLAMSHAIEDQAVAADNVRLVCVLFQQGLNARRQAARYRRLAERAGQVIAFGFDLPEDALPGMTLVELAPGHPLRNEWAILVVADHFQVLFTTYECERDARGHGVSYRGAWTSDPETVNRAAQLLLEQAGPALSTNTALRALGAARAAGSPEWEAGAGRMRGYVERNVRRLRERERQLERTNLEMVTRLAWAAEQKDEVTGGHLWRVAGFTRAIAEAMRLPAEAVERLSLAAPMHDIGKLHIDDAVLRKPGKLDEAEFEHVKSHTLAGARILTGSPSPLLQTAEQIARWHHERWDGSGYPDGLSRTAIPLDARIVSVADVFDALTSPRPYKPGFPFDQSLSMIADLRGRHFDPDVVDVFLSLEDQVRAILAGGVRADRFAWSPEHAA